VQGGGLRSGARHLEFLERNPLDRRLTIKREALHFEAQEIALNVFDGAVGDHHLLQSDTRQGVVVDTKGDGLLVPVEGGDADFEPAALGLIVDDHIHIGGDRMEHEAAVRVEDGEHVATFFSGERHHVPGFAIVERAGEVDFSSEHSPSFQLWVAKSAYLIH